MSDAPPALPAVAAGGAEPSRRRRVVGARLGRGAVPYLLLAPAVAVIAAVLAYPLYLLVSLSFQQYGLVRADPARGHVDRHRQLLDDPAGPRVLDGARADDRVHGRVRRR